MRFAVQFPLVNFFNLYRLCFVATASSEPTLCPEGTFRDIPGGVEVNGCTPCLALFPHSSTVGAGANDISVCVCQAGFFSDETEVGTTTCLPCTDGMICDTSGLTVQSLVTNDGYWRSGITSVHVIECPYGDHACPNATADECKPGFDGFLCASCEAEYFKASGPDTIPCKHCPVSPAEMAMELTVLVLMCTAAAVAVVGKFMKNSEEILHENDGGAAKRDKSSVAVRLLLSYMQVLGLVGKFDLHWPDAVNFAFESSSSVTSFNFFSSSVGGSLDCLTRPVWMELPVYTLLGSSVLIGIISVATVVSWRLIYPLCQKCRNNDPVTAQDMNTKMVMTAIALGYMMYSSFATAFFGLFSCVGYDGESSRRLRNGLGMKCFESDHMFWVTWLGMPFGLLVIVGMPLSVFAAISRHKGDLAADTVVAKFGFLFKGESELSN